MLSRYCEDHTAILPLRIAYEDSVGYMGIPILRIKPMERTGYRQAHTFFCRNRSWLDRRSHRSTTAPGPMATGESMTGVRSPDPVNNRASDVRGREQRAWANLFGDSKYVSNLLSQASSIKPHRPRQHT